MRQPVTKKRAQTAGMIGLGIMGRSARETLLALRVPAPS
jgi:hypothetical protein